LAPGIYFRLLLVGYFEGIDSERGIAWRAGDSLSIREFVGIPLNEEAPDHTTISRTRRLIDLETHQQVFAWVLERLAEAGLVKGKRIGIDATALEANAALRSIVRRDNGDSYEEFLKGLARQSGIETPTREDLGRVDRKRKKKGSNRVWVNPHDPDARITKMKDGRTHLAHKAEHAVDMDTGAVVAVTLQEAHLGDTTTVKETLAEAGTAVAELIEREAEAQPLEKPQIWAGSKRWWRIRVITAAPRSNRCRPRECGPIFPRRSKPGSGIGKARVQQRLACSVGGESHRGKSQKPRSLDSREEGNRISETY